MEIQIETIENLAREQENLEKTYVTAIGFINSNLVQYQENKNSLLETEIQKSFIIIALIREFVRTNFSRYKIGADPASLKPENKEMDSKYFKPYNEISEKLNNAGFHLPTGVLVDIDSSYKSVLKSYTEFTRVLN